MKDLSSETKGRFLKLYELASGDNEFSKVELKLLYDFAIERGVNSDELQSILSTPSYESEIPAERNERIILLYELVIMILWDDIITQDEHNLFEKYCLKLGFKEENVVAVFQFLLDHAKKNTSRSELLKIINS